MKISRRSFVVLSGAAAAASLGLSGIVAGQKRTPDGLSSLSADRFRTYIGTEFQISTNDLSFTATLSEVKDFAIHTGECFSLTFNTVISNPGQQRFHVSHFALGNFDLLMVGNKKSRNTSMLVATINRL
jgi:hypothetical protein